MVKHQAIGLKMAIRGTANTTGMFFSLYPFFFLRQNLGGDFVPYISSIWWTQLHMSFHTTQKRERLNCNVSKAPGFSNIT